jgi:hypothetical protein
MQYYKTLERRHSTHTENSTDRIRSHVKPWHSFKRRLVRLKQWHSFKRRLVRLKPWHSFKRRLVRLKPWHNFKRRLVRLKPWHSFKRRLVHLKFRSSLHNPHIPKMIWSRHPAPSKYINTHGSTLQNIRVLG